MDLDTYFTHISHVRLNYPYLAQASNGPENLCFTNLSREIVLLFNMIEYFTQEANFACTDFNVDKIENLFISP